MDTSEPGVVAFLRDSPPMSPTRPVVSGHSPLSLVTALALLVLTFAECSAQIVINEVLADNHLTSLDDDLDDPDWVELFNGGTTAHDLTGYGLSDDPENPRKWILPEIVVEAGEYLLVWCSGKDRVEPSTEAIERPGSTVQFVPSLVTVDAEWRYLTGSPEDGAPPEGWMRPDFDDTTWNVGRPGFGFGDDDDETELPRNIGTVFLRHVFGLGADEIPSRLVLRACYDDGFVAYINGLRVVSANVPVEEEPTFASTALDSLECDISELFDLSGHRDILASGDNVLSMALLNVKHNNADLSLIPELGTVLPFLHTNFKINSHGETILLTDSLGQIVDRLTLPPQAEDHSFGRLPDAGPGFFYMLHPTPLATNRGRASDKLIPARPHFEPGSGMYPGPVEVTISAGVPFEGMEIRYTVNGESPSISSLLHEKPIRITSDTVIRAAAFLDGEAITRIRSSSYFLSPRALDLTLPVLAISMNPEDFEFVHLTTDRRGRGSERAAYLEIFDSNGSPAVATGFGMRLHGGSGRQGGISTQKAYKAYFRRCYGDRKLRYPVIPGLDVEDFDKLVLRSSFNDAFRLGGNATLIRDQLIRDLHEDMGGVVSHGFYYNMFINMEYRGIYNVVERLDKDFLASHFPGDGENWDVVKRGFGDELLDGTLAEWFKLKTFMRTNDLGDDALFDEALQLVDVECFTAYMILNIWAQNQDWPQQNWYAARPQRPDGQWIFLSWDAESGLGGIGQDTLAHVFDRQSASLTAVFNGFLENPRYQQFFLDELDRHFASTLAPENVVAHIRRLARIVETDIDHHVALTGHTAQRWRNNIQTLETFAARRNPIIRDFVVSSEHFSILQTDPFRRGDSTGEGSFNIGDPVTTLFYLLGQEPGPICEDAMDADDSGTIDISDVIFVLNHLFRRGTPLPAPSPAACGFDLTSDTLSCDGPTACP